MQFAQESKLILQSHFLNVLLHSVLKEIQSILVFKEDICNNEEVLSARWEALNPIKGLDTLHFFQSKDENNILVAKTCSSSVEKVTLFSGAKEGMAHYSKLSLQDVYTSSES